VLSCVVWVLSCVVWLCGVLCRVLFGCCVLCVVRFVCCVLCRVLFGCVCIVWVLSCGAGELSCTPLQDGRDGSTEPWWVVVVVVAARFSIMIQTPPTQHDTTQHNTTQHNKTQHNTTHHTPGGVRATPRAMLWLKWHTSFLTCIHNTIILLRT